MKINKNFLDLEASYLFSTVNKKTREFIAAHPEGDVIKLSIGDVTKPLCPAVIEAMHKAVDEMADEKTFRGYPPEAGYDFVREKIPRSVELICSLMRFSFLTVLNLTVEILAIFLQLIILLQSAILFTRFISTQIS